jgi:hypothetical protein
MRAVDHEQAELDRIRNGPAGRIRPESELSNRDVARAMNSQLQAIKPDDVNAIIISFPAEQRAKVRAVLAQASGFGSMDSFNAIRVAMQPHLTAGGKLYVPGSGSVADNIVYLAGKQTFDRVAGAAPGEIETTKKLVPKAIVVLDPVILHRVQADPAFAKSLVDNHCVLLEPHGFTGGLNLFNTPSPEVIAARTAQILEQAQRLHAAGGATSFEEAIDAALGANTRSVLAAADPGLQGQVRVVHATEHPDVSSAAIADQLNGGAGITEEEVGKALAGLSTRQQHNARELLARQGEIFSSRRVANELAEQHRHAMAQASQRGVSADNVYFYIPKADKSYGMLAMAHREVTGTAVGHYINGVADLKARSLGSNTLLVVLDDVAGSGHSLQGAMTSIAGAAYQGHTIIAPMVSTDQANQLFSTLALLNPNLSFQPRDISRGLMESDFYKGLDPELQAFMHELVGDKGYGGNALSMAFPYMAPDNNNAVFGDRFASHFIVNKNRSAAKSSKYTPPIQEP